MADDSFRIAELLLEGFTCGHILAKLALEAQGRDNPDLVRAMSGLARRHGPGLQLRLVSQAAAASSASTAAAPKTTSARTPTST